MHTLGKLAVLTVIAALPALACPGAAAQVLSPPQAAAAPDSPATTKVVRVVSMRAGPGSESAVIGTLHPGETVEVLATANHGWMQLRTPAGEGWAYGSYLATGTGGGDSTPQKAGTTSPLEISSP